MKIEFGKYADNKVTDLFNPGYFWDAVIEELSFKRDYPYIISRVVGYSFDKKRDYHILRKIYRPKLIKKIAKRSDELKGFELIVEWGKLLSISPKEFKYYNHNAIKR